MSILFNRMYSAWHSIHPKKRSHREIFEMAHFPCHSKPQDSKRATAKGYRLRRLLIRVTYCFATFHCT